MPLHYISLSKWAPVRHFQCAPLQDLNGFEVTDQLPPDAMHDVLEGGVGCVLRRVLGGLIQESVLEAGP